jgi:hypothetical protein
MAGVYLGIADVGRGQAVAAAFGKMLIIIIICDGRGFMGERAGQ